MVRARKPGRIPGIDEPLKINKKQPSTFGKAKFVGGKITEQEIRNRVVSQRKIEHERLRKMLDQKTFQKLINLEERINQVDEQLKKAKDRLEHLRLTTMRIQLIEEVSEIHKKVQEGNSSAEF